MEDTQAKADEKQPTRFGLFLGCIIPTEQYAYELSLRKIMPQLGVELVDLEGFSCCGAPLRSINLNLSRYLSIRNLAICSKEKIPVLAPCPLCHLALTEAKNLMENQECAEEIEKYKAMLAEEDLEYSSDVQIYHTLDLLHDSIGLELISDLVKEPLSGINFATHYGCHLIRPTLTTRPDHPENPKKMDAILSAIGGNTKDYPEKLNCCGGPLILNLADSALTKAGQKLKAVQDQGFDGLVDTCPWGHRLFDSRQKNAADTVGEKLDMPVFYITQLVGLAIGIDPKELGLEFNLSPIDKIEALNLGGLSGELKQEEDQTSTSVSKSTPTSPSPPDTEQNQSNSAGGD
jgi:heterodisulfide reductase subunit B